MRKDIRHVYSNESRAWADKEAISASSGAKLLRLSGDERQAMNGFGGCFNELGYKAILSLDEEDRRKVMSDLFEPKEDGCNLSHCRVPIGANDYAEDWYSLDEFDGDYAMEKFSLERDERMLIPYIRAAKRLNPGLKLFASPWSPPTWMKKPAVYDSGRLRMEDKVLKAYALYFLKYLRAYRAEGIDVVRLFVQNEPFADTKYPSCLWSAEQFAVFIRDYLGPLFEREGEGAELWLGTLNGPKQMVAGCPSDRSIVGYDEFVDRLLLDGGVRRYLRGVGYQWEGKANIQRTHESFPELGVMQTENECGDGRNGWDYAFYVFGLMRHYLANGADAYCYWNMVLESGGMSSWGWLQNSMISVDPSDGSVALNPEYYVMKHFSRFVPRGSRRLRTGGAWTGSSVAFERPDGSIALVVGNLQGRERGLSLVVPGGKRETLAIEPMSINTLVLG